MSLIKKLFSMCLLYIAPWPTITKKFWKHWLFTNDVWIECKSNEYLNKTTTYIHPKIGKSYTCPSPKFQKWIYLSKTWYKHFAKKCILLNVKFHLLNISFIYLIQVMAIIKMVSSSLCLYFSPFFTKLCMTSFVFYHTLLHAYTFTPTFVVFHQNENNLFTDVTKYLRKYNYALERDRLNK